MSELHIYIYSNREKLCVVELPTSQCPPANAYEHIISIIQGTDEEMFTVNGEAITNEITTFPAVDHETTSTSTAVPVTSGTLRNAQRTTSTTASTMASSEILPTTKPTIASTAVTYVSTFLAEHTTKASEKPLILTTKEAKATVHTTHLAHFTHLSPNPPEALVTTAISMNPTTVVEEFEPIILTRAENNGECYITQSSCESLVVNAKGLNRSNPDSSVSRSIKCIVATLVVSFILQISNSIS